MIVLARARGRDPVALFCIARGEHDGFVRGQDEALRSRSIRYPEHLLGLGEQRRQRLLGRLAPDRLLRVDHPDWQGVTCFTRIETLRLHFVTVLNFSIGPSLTLAYRLGDKVGLSVQR